MTVAHQAEATEVWRKAGRRPVAGSPELRGEAAVVVGGIIENTQGSMGAVILTDMKWAH